MNLISFFGLKVKPRITRGKGMWNPLNTQISNGGIICIRDKDVNCFLIKGNDGYIAIDSGYKNSQNVRNALAKFGITVNKIKAVFLTHLDIDHAGGMDKKSNIVFPCAKIYLGYEESKYLSGQYCRKKVLFHKCKLPITLDGWNTLGDNETVICQNIKIQAVYAFGHTLGHTAYIVNDKILFSGDCIIANENGGYCFYDFWNSDTKLNIQSLKILKQLCNNKKIEKIYTSHSGILEPTVAFKNYNKTPTWRKKGFIFCKSADINPYK